MDNLRIEPTKFTPEVSLDSEKHLLELKGKSYPENTEEFYDPVFKWLKSYLEQPVDKEIIVNVELLYFNSSSSKILMNFFDMLEEASNSGRSITVNWIYDDDETILEYGEEFKEDMESLRFNLIEKGE